MSQPFFDLQDVSFTYPGENGGRTALQHVVLRIEEGEFVALVGANGSGKTTLARHLNGLFVPTSGKVLVNGLDTRRPETLHAIHHRVGMVFQFPEDQIVAATVEEDTSFGPENLGLPPEEIRTQVEAALGEVGMWEYRSRSPNLLSAGQMQRLALAGVLAMRPKAIIFDEATTMLDPVGRRRTMETLKRLHQEEVTVIYVTHFMEEAVEAERILVMHAGQLALDGPKETVFSNPEALKKLGLELPGAARIALRLKNAYPMLHSGVFRDDDLVNQFVSLYHPSHVPDLPVNLKKGGPAGSLAIRVEDLSHTYLAGTPLAHLALDGVSLTVATGACQGLAGTTGSGKSTLLQHLNGLLRPQQGQVWIGPLRLNDPKITIKEIIQQVGLVFQNPEASFFEYYVGDEVAYGPRQLLLNGKTNKKNEADRRLIRERVRDALAVVGLDFDAYKDRPTSGLSGGEKRKVALAAILALHPHILALDEPTAGLDPASRGAILANLGRLMADGMTLVVATHQMEVLAELGGCMTVLRRGQQVLDGRIEDVFDQPDRLTEFNLEPPEAAHIAYRLREVGWALPGGITTENQFVRSMLALKGVEGR